MKIYVVQKGDTFEKIAKEYNLDMDALIRVNPQVATPEMLLPGMKVKIPQERKQIMTDQKKSSKSNAKKENEKHNIPKGMYSLPVIKEDDTWKKVKSQVPRNTASEKKNNQLESKTQEHIKSENRKQVATSNSAFQSIRHNPISIIRNQPNGNIPEVSLLQLIQ